MDNASALRFELAAGTEAEYSSNVLRREDGEEDLALSLWGGLGIYQQSATTTVEALVTVEERNYVLGNLGDESRGELASRLEWRILPQGLSWHLEDYLQDVPVDVLDPLTPANRQYANVFWTGPDLSLPIAQIYSLDLGLRYGNYYYEITEGDHHRYAALARFSRRLSEQRQVFVGTQGTRVRYKDDDAVGREGEPLTDYDQLDAYVGFAHETRLTTLTVMAGRTYIDRTDQDDLDDHLLSLTLRRRLARNSMLHLDLSSRLTDSGSHLLASQGGRLEVGPIDGYVIQDITRSQRAELGYSTDRWGVTGRLNLFARKEDYEVADRDRKLVGIYTEVGFPLSTGWQAVTFLNLARTEYDQLDYVDRDYSLGFTAERRLSRNLYFTVALRADHRDSTGSDRDFTDYVGLLGLQYGQRPTWTGR